MRGKSRTILFGTRIRAIARGQNDLMDWSKLPDLGAIALLTFAFGSVARRNQTPVSGLWLTGWVMIALHFAAFLVAPRLGSWGPLAIVVGLASLTWAGLLFMWASVPYRGESSSRWMLGVLLGTNTLYIALITIAPNLSWALVTAAALFGILPAAVTLVAVRRFSHLLRWTTVFMYADLAIFLLAFQRRPGNGADLALNAVLFTVYLGCGIHFWHAYRRATAGAFITIAGFFTWAAVFVVAPGLSAILPALHLESEVWNLPKYVVAVGMILLVLEDQIEHNKFLALHDELTGLPNRRLFQDRLEIALERARRTGAETALLLVDLNYFKRLNDTAGHHVGDMLLRRVSEMFARRVRRSDTVARTGGDEFSIILEAPVSRCDAEKVAQALIHMLEQPIHLGPEVVSIGASVGVAMFPEDAITGESLCIAADRRMYEDKHASRKEELDRPTVSPMQPSMQFHG
jgi:diguanylate cyclase